MQADPGFVGLSGSATDSLNQKMDLWTDGTGLKWLLISFHPEIGAYWKYQTNMLVVKANERGAGILPAVLKEGLLEAGPTLQRLNNQLPRRGLFFRAGSRKKPRRIGAKL